MRRLLSALLSLCLLAIPVSNRDDTKYIALTFDDGPSGRYTRALLDGLKERDVKATFFLCGYRIREYPQETQRIADGGHEIGCHGFSHTNMQALSRLDIAKEIMDMQSLLPPNTRVRFLRPPGGCCSDAVQQVAQARQLAIANWSVDPKDWASSDSGAVVSHILKHVHDGDIVLLHDMSDSSVQAALAVIDALREEGYAFVTVSELARLRNVSVRPGKVYSAFPSRT